MTYYPCFSRSWWGVSLMILSYLQLADDVGGPEERRLLKGEHGVLAL
jgi:hypothetical protein